MAVLSVGQAWEEAKATFTADRARIVPVALFMILLPAALMTMLTGVDQSGKVEELPPAVAAAILLIMLVTLVGQLGIARLALQPAESVGEALKVAARRMWSVLGAALLVFGPLLVPLILIGEGQGGKPTGPAAIAGLVLIVAVLFIAIRICLSSIVAVAEGSGPVAIVKRSFALTKGNVGRIAAFFLLLLSAALLLSWAVGVVAGVLMAFGDGAVEPFSLKALLLGLVQGAIEAGLVTTFVLMLASLYRQAAGGAPA